MRPSVMWHRHCWANGVRHTTRNHALRCALMASIAMSVSTVVYAQTDNQLAVGANVTTSSSAGNSAAIRPEIRVGHETDAWVWQTSLFGWFDTDVQKEA